MKLMKIAIYILLLPILVIGCSSSKKNERTEIIKFGIIADIQYCDCETRGSRFYRNSLQKLDECVQDLNKEKVQFTINLGDLVDRDTPHNLDSILIRLDKLNAPLYNTTGNHDYDGVTDNDKLYKSLNMPNEYYSFNKGKWKFIVLNTNEIAPYANVEGTEKKIELESILQKLEAEKRPNWASYNGGISSTQMQWLEQELEKAQEKSLNTLVFSHHPLCGVEGLTALNDLDIIELLSKFSVVKGVISGHHHSGAFDTYKGIPFITTEGMIETEAINAYGIVTINVDKIEIKGKGRTKSYTISL